MSLQVNHGKWAKAYSTNSKKKIEAIADSWLSSEIGIKEASKKLKLDNLSSFYSIVSSRAREVLTKIAEENRSKE
jgi:hypothetical protein